MQPAGISDEDEEDTEWREVDGVQVSSEGLVMHKTLPSVYMESVLMQGASYGVARTAQSE